jgi:hypothetical protein
MKNDHFFDGGKLIGSLALFLSALAIVPQATEARGRGYQLHIANRSSYGIHHIYLSSSQEDNWGPDQLGERTIEPGEAYTLRGIPPDEYDVRIVDEDQDICEVRHVPIAENASVTLTDELLQTGQQRTRQRLNQARSAR